MESATEFRCPACDSLIYSRRNFLCGVCAQPLPEQLLFNKHERAAADRQLAELKQRARMQSFLGSSTDSSGGGYSGGYDGGGCDGGGGGGDCG